MDPSKSDGNQQSDDTQHIASSQQRGMGDDVVPSKNRFSRRADTWWRDRQDRNAYGWRPISPRYKQEHDHLKDFSFEERQEILSKREVLSSLAYFIGKDFRLPVFLGAPGSGWSWDPQQNSVTIDSRDVLNNPLGFLRFVTCHEGAHRRISRLSTVPDGLIERSGFMMLLNGLEDPRVNNYLCEAYPVLQEDMSQAISFSLAQVDAVSARVRKERGFVPESITAVGEIIREWFTERENIKSAPDRSRISARVEEFLEATRSACQKAYYTYPTRKETESGEQAVLAYSKVAYKVIADEIWPHFQVLLERDKQQGLASEVFSRLAQGAGEKPSEGEQDQQRAPLVGNRGVDARPEDTPREGESSAESPDSQGDDAKPAGNSRSNGAMSRDAVMQAVAQALSQDSHAEIERALERIDRSEAGEKSAQTVKEFSTLSEAAKEELASSATALPDEAREDLEAQIRRFLQAMEQAVSDQLKGQLSQHSSEQSFPTTGASEPTRYVGSSPEKDTSLGGVSPGGIRADFSDAGDLEKFRRTLKSVLAADGDRYNNSRKEVLSIIDTLERDLRKLFQERRESKVEDGMRFGPSMSIDRRISETAAGVHPVDSRAFTRRSRPMEKDYAFCILVDLSGSMRYDDRMSETFKATIALAEVLNRLGINFEILGFNDQIHEYKAFYKRMGPDIRKKMGTMPDEIFTPSAKYNDDGWALTEASQRLAAERNECKFLLVLSDGRPEPSDNHNQERYELSTVIKAIRAQGKQILIGLGIGGDTGHVSSYYPNSVADISTAELPQKLAAVIEQAIRNPETFSR